MTAYVVKLIAQWGRALLEQIPHIVQALIVVAIILFIDGRLRRIVARAVGEGRGRRELARLLGRLVRIALILSGALLVLGIFNQTQLLASFLTSLGIFGLLIAFALQDITKNFAAGVLLLLQRPFGLGERIRVGTYEGIVTDVSLRATVLRTIDGLEVLIPNADVYSGAITNLTRYPHRRYTVAVTLSYEFDAAVARAALEEALRAVPQLEVEPPPQVAATGVGKDDQQFEARFWLPSGTADLPAIVASVTLALQQAVQRLHRLREA